MVRAASHLRFPYGEAAFCAVCLCVAAYTWMKHSYAWPATADEVSREYIAHVKSGAARKGELLYGDPGPYMAIRGTIDQTAVDDDGNVHGSFGPMRISAEFPPGTKLELGVERVYVGRMWYHGGMRGRFTYSGLDGTASRYTAASVTGLIVGAAGLCVFALSVRRWLRKRGSLPGT